MTRYSPVEPFDGKRHRTDRFTSAQPSLDLWLRAYASQRQRRDASRTFVVTGPGTEVAGYYTLVVSEIAQEQASVAARQGMSPRFPIPVVLIARLAVDQEHRGRGLGRSLLFDSLQRIDRASRDLGIRAVLADAIDEDAARFYRQYGFEPSELEPNVLMVTMQAVRRVLGSE